MKKAVAGLVGVLAAASTARAEAPRNVPDSGFYVGAGASANLVVPTSQTIFAQGISNVSQGGVPAASGAAGGPTSPNVPMASTVSPSAQLGYFQRLSDSRWLLGGKLTYNYIAATATDNFVLVPQSGSFALVGGGPVTSFTGNLLVRSYQITADHQFALVPYVGYAFDRGYVYLGGGPSLTRTEIKLSGVVGFASINGTTNNITGAPTTYASSQWLVGGTFAGGATYFLTSSWFVDIGYAFTLTDLWNTSFASPFANTAAGFTTAGIVSGNYTGGLNSHALTVSINRRF